ncbi:hypothetical protein Jiend_57930 [Micromonospora endophytica]|uniref:(d)CMP kinase n=1 Tax=Micromonospora endophytica TaxID=515350 RepID=UPI001BB3151E|nr:(d)CMP kinase [Micromonospora endophytica]BCJ62371.1 hypothetical protein Jiend_57930 [Micromonospora endophytica]
MHLSVRQKDSLMRHGVAISIDGPSASGKTSLAYALASRLGTRVLDTGLTYRAVAYAASRGPLPPDGRLFDVLRHELAAPGRDRPSRLSFTTGKTSPTPSGQLKWNSNYGSSPPTRHGGATSPTIIAPSSEVTNA